MKLFKKFLYIVICASLLTAALGVQPVYAASIVVNNNADDTLANLNANATCDLRQAITNANNDNQSGSTDCAAGAGADAITFAGNYVITLAGSQLPAVTSQITITGNGAANTIVQANANPNTTTYRVFEVSSLGNLTLDDLTVRYGRCNGLCATNSANGGGIFNQGTLTVTNSTLSGNSAVNGGGIFNQGTLTVTNSSLLGNSVGTQGGGIYNDSSGTLTVKSSVFSSNSAYYGGGIYSRGAATLTNSTLSGNSVSNRGGGIYSRGTLTLANSTLSNNLASQGGDIYNNFDGTLHYSNTIIANSTSGGDCYNNGGTIGTNVNNLVEDGTCSPALSGDPNLAPLADNGGPTQIHALLAGSIAIDAGNAATCAAAPVNNLDQRGVTRPIDGDAVPGAVCDIGAYEYSTDTTFPTVVFTNLIASYAAGAGPSNFTVTYSENVFDPAGNANPDDVTNPANYLLVEDGADNAFDTLSCAGGLVADDTQVAVTGVTYNAGLFTATVTLSGAVPDGNYRLFVCGTTSIVDLSLNELNNGLSDYTFNFVVGAAATTTPSVSASSLPTTGFAPSKVTQLPAQPAELAYAALGDLWLEIPSQQIKSSIVGVPQAADDTWDVTWLGNDTGWLNGSAFPTWNGNSVLTAHVTNASGLPGPFANLKDLKYGDRIIVHLSGQSYVYEVRDSRMTRPFSTSFAFQSMQDHSYLTLITCQGYIPFTDSYFFRRIVRAVLVEVK